MSLKGRSEMLGVDRQGGNGPSVEPGADPGFWKAARKSISRDGIENRFTAG
jgi:hypothetical protein